MTTHRWTAPTAIASALTTELNSLADGAYSAASSAIDNTSNRYTHMALEINLASLTPATSPYLAVYLLPSIDGTNYVDGGGATAPPAGTLVAVVDLSTSAGVKLRGVTGIPVPPLLFKLVLLNEANVALGASGNTVEYRLYSEEDV